MNEIIKVFQERMDESREGCTDVSEGMRNQVQLRWMFSKPVNGTAKPGKFDVNGLHQQFDRSEAEDIYINAVEDAGAAANNGGEPTGTRQEMAIAKAQSDILSAMERDFHQRRRSRIRMLAHESSFRSHLGSGRGAIQSNIMAYLQVQMQRLKKNGNGNQ